MKPIHFVRICCLLATTLAFGQANNFPLRNQPIAPETGRPSESPSAPMPPGSQRVPARAQSRKQQTPQGAEFSVANAVTYDSGGFGANVVSAADVNGDGKPDLVVVNACGSDSTCSTNGSVGVLLNIGNGTFGTAVAYSSNGWSPIAVAVADVNGDGNPDIVVVNQCPTNAGNAICATDGTVAVLLGNGDGTFQAAVNYDSGGYVPHSVAIADVNGDGKPDLVVVNSCGSAAGCSGDSTVAVLLGKGDGTFQPGVNYDTGGFGANSVAVADLRGDGKLDLVAANSCGPGCPLGIPGPGSVGVLLGNGDGTFQAVTAYPSDAVETDAVAVADVNGDGKLDIAASSRCGSILEEHCGGFSGGLVDVFLGNGDGTFQGPTPYATSATFTGGVAIADVNGDGKPDLEVSVTCGPESNACASPGGPSEVGVLLGNGDGTFQAVQYFGSTGENAYDPGLAVADLNGDGRPDLILTNLCADVSCATTAEPSIVGVLINTSVFPNSVPSTTTVISSPNPSNAVQSVTFSVTVSASGSSSTPAGTVSLVDGSMSLGLFSLNSSGTATVTITTLPAGTNNVTATYNGDANLTPSASVALSQVVIGQDFSLTSSSPSATVMPGQTATYTVAVSPLGGFDQTVSLSCSGAPAQSTCSLSSNSVTLNGSTPTSVTVTVTTAGNSAVLAPLSAFPNSRGALLLCMALFGLPGLLVLRSSTAPGPKRRRRFVSLLGMCVVSLGLSSLGCGGSGGNGAGTQATTYNLSVTGTFASGSTALSHTAKLTLVVE